MTVHHITLRTVRLYSMKGGVLLYIETCGFVLPCASRDAGWELEVAKRIVMAAWMLHGLRFGRKPGQETLCFSV